MNTNDNTLEILEAEIKLREAVQKVLQANDALNYRIKKLKDAGETPGDDIKKLAQATNRAAKIAWDALPASE